MNRIFVFDRLASTNDSLLKCLDGAVSSPIKEDKDTWRHPLAESRLQDIDWGNGDMLLALGQTDGKGQQGNHWEAEYGKNLTFSFLLCPKHLAALHFFQISQAVSLAVCELLDRFQGEFIRPEPICIKWPNDIYVGEHKIAGILIENRLSGTDILYSIVGIGLNINQEVFRSDAPNPVSLRQLTSRHYSLPDLAQSLHQTLMKRCQSLSEATDATLTQLQEAYFKRLYRREGFFPYHDKGGQGFLAEIDSISPQGFLHLRTDTGDLRRFAFKEVKFG